MIIHLETDAEWFADALCWATISLFRRAARRCFRLPYRITLTNGDGTLLADLVHDGPEAAEEWQARVEPTVHIQQVDMFHPLCNEMLRQMKDAVLGSGRPLQTPVTLELVGCCGRREDLTIEDTTEDIIKKWLPPRGKELQ